MNTRQIFNYINEYYNHIMKDYPEADCISIRRGSSNLELGRNQLTDFIGSTINFTIWANDEDMDGTDYSIPFITPQLAVGLWGTDRIGKGCVGEFDEGGFTYSSNKKMTLFQNGYCKDTFGATDNYWNPVVDTTLIDGGTIYTYLDGKSFYVKPC